MSNKADFFSNIRESDVSPLAKVYSGAEVNSSTICAGATIGNDAVVIGSKISEEVSINRRNYILRSEIGSYTYTGIDTSVRSSTIGKFCSISWNVSIGGGNHDYMHASTYPKWRFDMKQLGISDHKANKALQKRFEDQGDCSIGNDVWLATNVVVLRGLKIGNGVVVGAGAVVTKDIEPYSIVVGLPARVVKDRFNDKTKCALEEIRWWDWPDSVLQLYQNLIFSDHISDDVLDRMFEITKSLRK